MSTFKYENFATPFHERLYSVIGNDIAAWANELGISQSTIRDGWFRKGSYPTADKLVEIFNRKKISIDWIISGIGPERVSEKNISDEKIDGDIIDMDQSSLYERFIQRLEIDLNNLRRDFDDLKVENERLRRELQDLREKGPNRPANRSAKDGTEAGAA